MKDIEVYFLLQDSKTQEFLCIDYASGGYPFFSDNYEMAEKFSSKEVIDKFFNGSKLNRAYKEMFPKECENLVIKRMTITTEICI